jgi:hypothetical protein
MKTSICLSVIWYILVLANHTISAQQPARNGEELVISLKLDTGNVELKFRYCLPGEIPLNAPWQPPASLGNYQSSGFYVQETELTYSDSALIFGDKVLAAAKQVVTERHKITPEGDYEVFIDAIEKQDPSVPAIFLTIEDIVSLCNRLDIEATAATLPATSIEGRTFRLLSLSEWRKAAIGQLPPNSSYAKTIFYNYPQLIDKGIITRLSAVLKSDDPNAEFKYSVESLYDVLSGNYTRENRKLVNQALRKFFSDTVLPKTSPKDLRFPNTYPVIAKYSTPNSLGIFDLLSGVCELTLLADSEVEIADLWQRLKEQIINDPENWNVPGIKCALAGGSFIKPITDPTNKSNDDWKKITVWGGPILENGAPKSIEINDFNEFGSDKHSGVRLGLFRTVRPNWYNIIRVAHEDQDSEATINQSFGKLDDTINQIGTRRDKEQVQPVIDFYRALSYYKTNDFELSTNRLSTTKFPEIKTIVKTVLSESEKKRRREEALGGGSGPSKLVLKKKNNNDNISYAPSTPAGENTFFVETLRELTKLDSELLK